VPAGRVRRAPLDEFGPEAQKALAQRYRDAFAVLDAVGWSRPADPPASVDVPITPGMAEQLFHRRYELGHANLDRLASCNEPDESL
jgi:hypothetical protein